eukprot:TRINITY_DN46249_c0_g1_i1.p1 TRINITY_DN46249_c0_g1~~TRINITY_DN46249_c0_g1_i1.p1  ORF type:complete len:343 (+),score=119.35 TRINITY_DN46249_c0_g1_i1:89-1117(+)
MPPKADKKQQQQREKVAVDKTFGMKNKNKSKVVQKYIKSITQNARGESSKSVDDQHKQKEQKKENLQQKALMAALFNQNVDKKGRAYDPVAKKKAKEAEEEAIAAGKKLKEEERKAIIEGVANTIRLTNVKGIRMSEIGGHAIIVALKEKYPDIFKTISLLLFIKVNNKVFWVDDPESTNPTIRCQEDVDAEVEPDDRPIEEIIEERRRALPPGGTPVTELSFKAWKEKKERERIEQIEEKAKAAKSKDGKSGAGLSGRDLFTFNASLFVDDDEAASAGEYDERSEIDDEEDQPTAGAAKECAESGDEDDAAPEGEEVKINKDLFLEGGDLPDDLDDLDDEE